MLVRKKLKFIQASSCRVVEAILIVCRKRQDKPFLCSKKHTVKTRGTMSGIVLFTSQEIHLGK